jgi:hypothetical protein
MRCATELDRGFESARLCAAPLREPHVLRVYVDGVDNGVRRAVGHPVRRIAERAAEFEDALRLRRGRNRAQQRAVVERIGAAAVARAVAVGLRQNGAEAVGGHGRGSWCR